MIKSHWLITNEEIFGKYELVTEYMSPLSQEIAVENYETTQETELLIIINYSAPHSILNWGAKLLVKAFSS